MSKRVLYIEDNVFSVSLMNLCLQKRRDFDLMIAQDGQSAWEQIQLYVPDIILMDINLPDMSGWELSRRLREHHATNTIPIIAVTSLNDSQSHQKSKDAGIDLHLNKSMIHSSLIPQIENLLSNQPITPQTDLLDDGQSLVRGAN